MRRLFAEFTLEDANATFALTNDATLSALGEPLVGGDSQTIDNSTINLGILNTSSGALNTDTASLTSAVLTLGPNPIVDAEIGTIQSGTAVSGTITVNALNIQSRGTAAILSDGTITAAATSTSALVSFTNPSVVETTDAAASLATSYALLVGQSAQGTISTAGDHDWYAISLTAGQAYKFALIGTGTNSLQDTYLNLRDASGNIVVFDDDSGPGLSSQISYVAPTSGPFFLDAGAYANASVGQYGLSAALGTKADFNVSMGAGAVDAYHSWSTPGTGATVTYGFRQSPASYPVTDHNISTFTRVSSAEMNAIQTILQLWSDVCRVTFTPINQGGYTDNATILIGNYIDTTDNAGAFAFYPGSIASTAAAGDLWLNTQFVSTSSIPIGSYSFYATMHEVGHALGLSHPGDYNAAPGVNPTYAINAQFVQDSQQYSVMSYFGGSNTGESPGQFATGYTPMMFDIYELQNIYGVNNSTRSSNTTYGFNDTAGPIYSFSSGTTPQFCIWDGGGIDTLDCSGFRQNQVIDLNSGSFSDIGGGVSNISIAIRAVIENVAGGSGNDTIIGNAANNIIIGGPGIDTSVYSGASKNYTVAITSGSGTYTVQDKVGTDGADTLASIERLQFTDQTIDTTNFTATAALPHVQLVELVDTYIAYLNRAPDAIGLDFWGGQLSHGASFGAIAAGFAASPEVAATYPATLSTADFVTAVYTNVLGRNTDSAGFNFWVNTLQTGAVTRGNFVLNVVESVLGQTGTPDAQYIANKYTVGAHFALIEGLSDGNWARTVMHDVDATAASVANANHATDVYAAIAANPATSEFVVHLVGVAI